MWAFMAVAIVHFQELVKSEMVNTPVPVISFATIGVTAVLMPVPVSSIFNNTVNPISSCCAHQACAEIICKID